MKQIATLKDRSKRDKLKELATRGIQGEAENAAAALAAMLERLDFEQPAPDDLRDIFAEVKITRCTTGETHLVLSFAPENCDIAGFVKWALEEKCQTRGAFRNHSIFAEVHRADLAVLQQLGQSIFCNFACLWEDFAQVPGVPIGARAPFLLGLYDGMMSDERGAGAMLPAVRMAPVKTKGKKKAVATVPGIAIHPYTVAVALGRKSRLAVPMFTIARELADVVEATKLENVAA